MTFEFTIVGGQGYRSVGLSFDLVDQNNFNAVYLSVLPGDPKVQLFHRVRAADVYPSDTIVPYPVQTEHRYKLKLAVRANLVNLWLDDELVMVQRLKDPLPFTRPARPIDRSRQRAEFDLIRDLNQLVEVEYPEDASLRARIKSYELAFEMQTAIAEVVDLADEPAHIEQFYGLDQPETTTFGRQCMVARRLVEKGVRFVQLFHGAEGGDGRDHHPFGFSVAMAGGGIQGGVVNGQTDELGFHAVEDRHYVTDIHATVLHQMGLDPRRLEIPGRKRLELDFGHKIDAILQ